MKTVVNSPRRPRVLHFITHLDLGGAERVALTLVRHLRPTHDFAVFAVHGERASAIGRSMRAELEELATPTYAGTSVPMKMGGMLPAGIGAANAVREFRPDLIHVHTEIPEAAYSAMVTLAPRLAAIPMIRTIHNSVYWHRWSRLGRWCEKRMLRSRVAAVSADALQAYAQHRAAAGAGEAPAPAEVIYNGVAEFEPAMRPARAFGGVFRLVFAGRFDEQKGTNLLPKILPLIQLPPCSVGELTLFGSGRDESLLRTWATAPPPGWTIHVHPPVPNLQALLPDFDLVLMPSRYEGLGLIAIETMLAGLPLVATDALGLREAMPPDYPWLAPAGDAAGFALALQRAITDRSKWPAVAERSRSIARQRFDPNIMKNAYARLYQNAMADSASPQR